MRATNSNGSSHLDRSYRPDIDGLRALAILSVVLYHSGLPWLTGGFTGVDIFFVISGYLIGGHIYAESRAGDFSYLQFYRRRAKRILPAFFVVLTFVMIAGLTVLSPAEMAQLGRSAFAASGSASNLLFWGKDDYFAPRSDLNPLLMTWSLGVEEQFYAVVPLLMVLALRLRRNWVSPAILSVCVLSFVFAWGTAGGHPMMAFYLLPARAWELGIGVTLAVAGLNRHSKPMPAWFDSVGSAAGLGLLLAPVLLLTGATAFPRPAALPSVLGTALLLAVPRSFINRRLLSLRPLVFIGKVSYSWYLCHWPLLAFMRILYGGRLPASVVAALIAASFGAAVLSYFFIEQHFRRSTRTATPLLLRYAGVSAGMLAMCAAVWLSHGIPQRFPALARMEAEGQALRADPCLAGYGMDEPNLSPPCYDASPADVSVALWGDSHSAALAPGLRSAALTQGYGFVELGKASCPPLTGATHSVPRIPLLAARCFHFNRKTLAVLQADPRIRIVILAAVWAAPFYRSWQDGWLTTDLERANEIPTFDASRDLFAQSLAATIRSLQAAGKQVVVVEDVPSFEIDPMWRIRSQRIPARRDLDLWLGVQSATDPGFAPAAGDRSIAISASLIEQTVAEIKGASLVDPMPALCIHASQCAYREGETLLYSDSSHLSPEGARYALRTFRLPTLHNRTE